MVMQKDSVKLIQRGLDQLLNVQVSTVLTVCDINFYKVYADIAYIILEVCLWLCIQVVSVLALLLPSSLCPSLRGPF